VPELILLTSLKRHSDVALLLLRSIVGAFLIWGVWDNIVSAERMREFVEFLTKFGFDAPQVMARLSVWAQFAAGVGFMAGLLTRWAGVICAINFAVALLMVDRFSGIRGAFPAAFLMTLGIYLALHGAGRFSLDSLLEKKVGAAS
jgi:putative oxidoreductase